MKSFWNFLHRLGDKLRLPDLPVWLVGVLAMVLILRIPSFFEPYYYGDEMIYMTLGQGVRQEVTLYKGIYDNKPPLLYLTAAASGSLFWFKAILCFWSLITIVIFYHLAKKLFERRQTPVLIATFIFSLLTTLPLLEGNIANAELFMIGPSILAFFLLLKEKLPKAKVVFFAGFLFGIATLFKVPAAFEAPVIVFYWIITQGFSNWKNILKNTLILIAGFIVPLLLTFLWYFGKGALTDYIKAAFLQNVGYLSSWRPGTVREAFLIRNGPLLIRGGVALIGSGILFIFRKRLSSKFVFLSLWTLFTLFAVTLSERPYPHYFIQAVAPISLFLGIFFAEKSVEQSLAVIPLAIAFFVPVYYKFWFYPTVSYYQRFIDFTTNKITKSQYFNEFGSTVNRNYQIADFLVKSSAKSEKVFMWDPDSATVYALSRRLPPIKYVADYHVNDYSGLDVISVDLSQNPPKFIILTSGHPFPQIMNLIKQKYILIQQIGNANIYSRLKIPAL